MSTDFNLGSEARGSDTQYVDNNEVLAEVLLTNVLNDPDNERGDLSADILELTESLRLLGLQERVRVYQVSFGRYMLASGHRRVAAARALGWKTIPAIISRRPVGPTEQATSRLVSNLCRKDIDPISLALSVRAIHQQFSVSIQEIAGWLGKTYASLNIYLRLLDLPEQIQEWLRSGLLSVGHAQLLLKIKEPEMDWLGNVLATAEECQVRLGRTALEENLSIRSLEIRVQNWLGNNHAIREWLAKQSERPAVASNVPARLTISTWAGNATAEQENEALFQQKRITAQQEVWEAMSFQEESGPSLDHIRLAALILADNVYFHDTTPYNLPDHGTLNRTIEKTDDQKELLNIIGRLVSATVITDLNLDGTDIVGERRSRWAKGRFNLARVLRLALP